MSHKKSVHKSNKMFKTLQTPPFLKPGDTVVIIAPSGVLKQKIDGVKTSEVLLKSWGLHVKQGKHLFHSANHFAGTDAQRAIDMQEALDNPNIKAIWCARGGYGAVRILDALDFSTFKTHPKWLIGYSDITAIHSVIHNEGVESLHAIMCVNLSDEAPATAESIKTLKNALFGENLSYNIKGSAYNRVGVAEGQLVGGNLTVLQTMLGSKTHIDTSGKILFIEEIGEYKYHIDRMLQSLKRAGYFDACRGVIVGDISNVKKNTLSWGATVEQLILDALSSYDFPIAFHMPSGHEMDNNALILGRTVRLHVTKADSKIVFIP